MYCPSLNAIIGLCERGILCLNAGVFIALVVSFTQFLKINLLQKINKFVRENKMSEEEKNVCVEIEDIFRFSKKINHITIHCHIESGRELGHSVNITVNSEFLLQEYVELIDFMSSLGYRKGNIYKKDEHSTDNIVLFSAFHIMENYNGEI